MTDEERLHMVTEQLILVRDNLFRGMSKSMQKLQARSINEALELENFIGSAQPHMTTNLHDKMLAAIDAYFSASDAVEEELAENLLLDVRDEINKYKRAEQSAQQDSPWCMKMNGCKTKCEDCPDEAPKIGCVNHDCDQCKAQQEPVDFTSLLREAEEIVQGKPTWKRFIDGTPLSNDIAVWMAVFAQDVARRITKENT